MTLWREQLVRAEVGRVLQVVGYASWEAERASSHLSREKCQTGVKRAPFNPTVHLDLPWTLSFTRDIHLEKPPLACFSSVENSWHLGSEFHLCITKMKVKTLYIGDMASLQQQLYQGVFKRSLKRPLGDWQMSLIKQHLVRKQWVSNARIRILSRSRCILRLRMRNCFLKSQWS